MNCSICRRQHSPKKLPFLCAVDARNALYNGRLENAQALVETEILERQVNAALSDLKPANPGHSSTSRARIDRLKSEEAVARDRTNDIIAQADKLKAELEAARKEIETKREIIPRRKSDIATVSEGTSGRRARQLDETQKGIHMTRYKWNRSSDSMAATRAFLCEEAARLYGLRQVKKGSTRRYELGGIEIIDLNAMNSESARLGKPFSFLLMLTSAVPLKI